MRSRSVHQKDTFYPYRAALGAFPGEEYAIESLVAGSEAAGSQSALHRVGDAASDVPVRLVVPRAAASGGVETLPPSAPIHSRLSVARGEAGPERHSRPSAPLCHSVREASVGRNVSLVGSLRHNTSATAARGKSGGTADLRSATGELGPRQRDDMLYRDESQRRMDAVDSHYSAWLRPGSSGTVAAYYEAVAHVWASDTVPDGMQHSERGFSARTEGLLAANTALGAGLQIIEARRRRRCAELSWPLDPPIDTTETRPHHSIHRSPYPQ